MVRRVLVIGATGILAPAVTALTSRGEDVVAVARNPRSTPATQSAWVDARDRPLLAASLADIEWDDALAYGPAVSAGSLAALRGLTPGRLVLVRTSAAADPALGTLIVPPDTLQLGWRPPGEPSRWHTPDEVSSAALAVLADGNPHTLGAVRPWSDRP